MSEAKTKKRSEWNPEEAMALLWQGHKAFVRGDKAEFDRIARLFPMDPYSAKAYKDVFGKDKLLALKMDLSEAEELYGKNWLDD